MAQDPRPKSQRGGGGLVGKLKESAEKESPIGELSKYVVALAAMLGGQRGREYKSCVFGAKGARKEGHVARCNKTFFGISNPNPKKMKKKQGGAGGSRFQVTAGPGQSGAAEKPRATEGR